MPVRPMFLFILAVLTISFAFAADTTPPQGDQAVNHNPHMLISTNHGDIEVELWPDLTPHTVDNFIALAQGTKEWTDPKTHQKVTKPFYDGLTFHRVIPDFMIQGGCPIGDGTGGPGYTFADECSKNGEEVTGNFNTEDDVQALYSQILMPYFKQTDKAKWDPELVEVMKTATSTRDPKPFYQHPIEWYQEHTGSTTKVYRQTALAPVDYGTICMANSGVNTNGSQFFIVTKKDGCPWLNGHHTVFGKVVKGMDVAEEISKVATDPQNNKPTTPVIINKIRLIEP